MSGLISVVVPTLNESEHVLRLLQSIRNQTYRPIEVVMVDVGSTDDTTLIAAQFAEQFSGKDFRLALVKAEVKVSAARNLGIQTSHGEHILLLDADFILSDSGIVQQLNDALETQDMAYFETRTVVDSWLEYQLMLDAESPLFAHNTIAGWAFKRELLESFQFDESLEFGEDMDFMIRLSKSGLLRAKRIESMGLRHFPHTLQQLRRQKLWYGRTAPVWVRKHHSLRELAILSPLATFGLFVLILAAYFYSIILGVVLTVVFLSIPLALLRRSRTKGVRRMGYLLLVRTIYGSVFFSLGFVRGLFQLLL